MGRGGRWIVLLVGIERVLDVYYRGYVDILCIILYVDIRGRGNIVLRVFRREAGRFIGISNGRVIGFFRYLVSFGFYVVERYRYFLSFE